MNFKKSFCLPHRPLTNNSQIENGDDPLKNAPCTTKKLILLKMHSFGRGGYSDFLKCLVPGTCCKYGPDLCLKIMKNRLKRRKMTLLVLLVPGFEQKRPKIPGNYSPELCKNIHPWHIIPNISTKNQLVLMFFKVRPYFGRYAADY